MFPDEEFDAILHLGPMYHLINRESRQAALTELARILKPGATAIVSYLNSWGVLRYGLSRFPERYADLGFLRGMIDDVAIPESFENFTECFWSTPPNAALEIEQAGFEVQTYIGCESFAAGQKAAIQKVAEENPSAYENILQFVRETCELEQFRSTGEHIHFVVQRQKSDAQKMRREH
jgi:SAM-dependent methyltransferase